MQQLCEAGEEEFLEIMALVGCFFAHIFLYSYILDILEIMALVGVFCSYILIFIYEYIYIFLIFSRSWHLWVFCSFIHSQYYNLSPLIFYLLLNAIFRWGWPANLCMCGDYKRRCRNGFKIRVNFPFFSKSD